MGAFQSGINNILMQTGIASSVASDKLKTMKAQKIAEKREEEESIANVEQLINDALAMSVGYTEKDIQAEKAGKAMGLDKTRFSTNPRGVSKKTYDRRMALVEAQREILMQKIQKKDFRDRMSKFSAKDVSQALNKIVRGKKKIGGDINGQKQ